MNTSYASSDPDIMGGTLCFKGTRVPVQTLFDYLQGGSTLQAFLEDFPSVSEAAAMAAQDDARIRSRAHAAAS